MVNNINPLIADFSSFVKSVVLADFPSVNTLLIFSNALISSGVIFLSFFTYLSEVTEKAKSKS
jgi:hypothetical protein